MMRAHPEPWDDCWPALFRLPMFGGAALFLRATAGIQDGQPVPRYDVSILTSDSFSRLLGRAAQADLSTRLSEFFRGCAVDDVPELTVQGFADESLGLTIAALASDDVRVSLTLSLGTGGADELSSLELEAETSRAALAAGAVEVRYLADVDSDADVPSLQQDGDW